MERSAVSVLLFEDDEGQAVLTREALEREGFAVEVCRTAREGLSRAAAREYEAVLIDMQMPDLHGTQILRRIAQLRPEAVAVIVTGHGDEVAAVDAMKLGAYDYVVKSPNMSHLAALPLVIRGGLERRRLKDQQEHLQTELREHARLLEERNEELRRANDELKRLNQLQADLVSIVSHELRTPLATINEFTALLSDQIGGPVSQEQQGFLGIIKDNVERLMRIINDLLDLAKIESGRITLDKAVVDVDALVNGVMQSMRPLAEAKGVSLSVERSGEAPDLFADADKVTQVLVNLLGNAIKFTDEAGRVTFRVTARSSELEFSVVDTGIGIAADDLPKLFGKFQQIRSTGRRDAQGTGLGLAISKRFVELHGGRIWATSAPGQGSVFSFTLPKLDIDKVFYEYLASGVEQAKRSGSRFSLLLVSISNFQELRALYGAEQTSRLLRELETALKDTVRRGAGDIIMGWERGEMVTILAEVDQAAARGMAERINRALAQRAFSLGAASVTLPIATATATYPDEALTAEDLLKIAQGRLQRSDQPRTRILVVDDEPKICQFLKEALGSIGYDVLTAASGPEALEQLRRHRVNVILLDLTLPLMNGYEVYHLLKEDPQTKDVPVIIVTADAERKDRQLGMERAPYNYVTKPFQLEDLLAKVRDVLVAQRAPAKPSEHPARR